MVTPINYLQQVSDPFAEVLQGAKIGAGMAELQQQQALREQQMQQAQIAAQEQARFFSKPNPTMRDALQFAAVLPKDRADALRPYIENFSKEQQQNVLKTNTQILSALQVNPETGIKMLRDYASAQRNAGDVEEAALYERLAEAAADPERGPGLAFKSLVTVTSRIPGAKEMFEAADKAASTARAEAEAPAELRQKIAAADKAVADAKTAQATATNAPEKAAADAALAAANAAKAQVDAQFAGPLAQANLNLNAAQIRNINRQCRRLLQRNCRTFRKI
jgi:colicin import membrane protein